MRILLVDDSKLQRYANAQALAHAGYNVTTAGDGAEGLRIARQTLADLILLDMMLPKMSGPDVLRALKADSLTAQIPVLVLTGLSQANEPKLLAEGAAGFFQKSNHMMEENSSQLINAVKRVLGRTKKQTAS
jgi:CheY-like chemotaxis protein